MRFCICVLILLTLAARSSRAQSNFPPITAADRIVVVAPHPDDEVIGAGGLIQQALAKGADVHVIYLTNGDHNQVAFKLYTHSLFLRARQYLSFGERRRNEAIAATGMLGLKPDALVFLGYPDWGTLRIWRDYWGSSKPFLSDATRVAAVPYKENFAYQHPYTPQSVTADLKALIRQLRPTRIFVSHPCDTNPDHRAAANFVRLALLDLQAEGLEPRLYYYLVHFGHWPRPLHFHPEVEMIPPRLLADEGPWLRLPLTTGETVCKYNAILQNRTQLTDSEYALVAFARANELFAPMNLRHIPNLPPDLPLDWRKAVRNKAILTAPGEPGEKFANHAAGGTVDESTALEDTMFLRQGDFLIAQIELKNRLGKRTNVHLSLFGYRSGEEFGALPKIQIAITPFGDVHVYDNGKRVLDHGITITSVANRFFLRVPLALLGGDSINRLFTSTRANFGEISADDTAWRLFVLSDGRVDPATVRVFSILPRNRRL